MLSPCPSRPCSGRRVLFDVAKGLYYLHQRRIVHLDLKSGEGGDAAGHAALALAAVSRGTRLASNRAASASLLIPSNILLPRTG